MYSIGFRWQNFRPFVDTGWLDIKPITILIGPNNSGKSSLIAPLLILKQTQRSARARSPLVLREDLINAGSFSDIANEHDPKKRVTFNLRLRGRPDSTEMPDLGDDAPAECSLTFKAEKAPGVISLYKYSVADGYGRVLLSRTRRASNRYSLDGLEAWSDGSDEPDVTESLTDQAARKAMREDSPFHFIFRSRNISREAVRAAGAVEPPGESSEHGEEPQDRDRPGPLRISTVVVQYMAAVDLVEHYMREHVLDLVYLGPLRETPQRLYEISGDAPADVGVRGQFSPELLLRNEKAPVFKRINRWLNEFGLEGSITCHRVTETAFALELTAEQSVTNFTDVGFGFSQLLPLIVQGLLARRNTLLIAEQPEIHLNPRLQAKLANLFQEIIKREVAILVETHSEHLLLAIRRLIAEGTLRSEDVAIYFVESTEGESHIREVPLQTNGNIEPTDWPKDFFADSLRESLALASAQARRLDAH